MSDDEEINMYVTKRNGNIEKMSYNKIISRLKQLNPNLKIAYSELVVKVMDQLYNNIETCKIDELICELCASMGTQHYDYSNLASMLAISNHQKEVNCSLVSCVDKIGNTYLSDKYINIVLNNDTYLESIIDHSRDFLIDYFGFKTLEKSY